MYSCTIRSGGCGRISIKAADIEDDIVERVLARLADAEYRRKLTEAINADYPEDVSHARADLSSRLAALGEDYADSIIPRETMHAGVARIQAKQVALELQVKRRETLDDLPEPDAEQIVKWWENASDARRRDVISVLLDHVTVKSTRRRGPAGLDPERLQRVWR